jgi:hypothetical protein
MERNGHAQECPELFESSFIILSLAGYSEDNKVVVKRFSRAEAM